MVNHRVDLGLACAQVLGQIHNRHFRGYGDRIAKHNVVHDRVAFVVVVAHQQGVDAVLFGNKPDHLAVVIHDRQPSDVVVKQCFDHFG